MLQMARLSVGLSVVGLLSPWERWSHMHLNSVGLECLAEVGSETRSHCVSIQGEGPVQMPCKRRCTSVSQPCRWRRLMEPLPL